MTTKTIAESTSIQGISNTITFTIRPDTALANGDVITIRGLTGTLTGNSGSLAVGGAAAGNFGNAGAWTQSTGVLVLTASGAIADNADTVITVALTNKASSQSAVTPTIEVSGGVTIGASGMSTAVLGAATAQIFTTKTIAESSTMQGVANTITFTLRPNLALAANDKITIVGLTGTQTGNSGSLTVAGAAAGKFGSAGAWTQSSGTLVLTVAGGQTVVNNADTVITISLTNKASSQSAVTPTISGSIGVNIASSSMSTAVLGAATAQLFTTKTIAESTTIEGVANTITFTLRPNLALAANDKITIVGLTGTQTGNSGSLTVAGAAAGKFGSAGAWTQSSGTLVLTVAGGQTVANNADTVITISLTNKASSQSAVTPTISGSVGVAIASSSMSTAVLGAATAQQYTTKTVSETSTVQDADNTLTFVLRPNVALSAADEITITGLTGSQTGNTGSLTVAGSAAGVFGSAGAWTQSTGVLVLTVASGQTVPNNADTTFTITIANKGSSQASKTATIVSTGSVAISSSSMSGASMSASTTRPTVSSASPNRIYKSSATTITFSGAGSLASGDKISIRTDCANAGTATATGTLDGSAQTALTIGAADASGKKICFQDVGNGFAYVDSGLVLPVVQITALTPGTSSSAAKVGIGIATTITWTGTGATTADRIKMVASGAACSATAVSGGGAYTLQSSGSTAIVTLSAAIAASKICYDPASSGFYTDTGLTLTAVVSTIDSVNVEKVVVGNSVSYTFTGTGLHNHASVKIHASTCSGTGSSGVSGGNAQSLSSLTLDRTQATLTFTINAAGTGYKFCLLVGGGAYAGSGAYLQPASLVVGAAAITSRNPTQIGTYVATTLTIAGTGLTNQDQIRLGNGNCNTAVTNAEASLTSATAVTVTAQASKSAAKICLKVFDSKRSDETFIDTGLTINIAPSVVNNVAGSRVAKSQAVTYTFTGFGLGVHMYVKIIGSSASCTGASATDSIITGGNGKVLASPSADGTSATAVFTLTQADSEAVNAKICLLTPATNYLGSGAYVLSGNSDLVTVVSIASRAPAQVGLYVVTQLTLTGNGLTTADKIAFGTSDCNTPVTNVNNVALTSGTAVDVTAQSARANALVCLLVSDSERTPAYQATGLTVTTATTTVSGVDVDKVVKGDTITFTFTGFGVDSHVKVKVVQASGSCTGTSHTDSVITGGGTGGGYSLTSATTAKTSATLSLTLNQVQTNAKFCFLVATTNYAGTGAYAATGASDVVTVMELASRSPQQLGLYVATTITISGSDLTTNDQIALSTSTACSGSWITNVQNVALTSGTAVTVTPQATSSSAKICLKAAGSSVYHYTGLTVVIATPTFSAISPTKVAKGDAIEFTFTGYGLGTFIKAKVVTSGTGCSGTTDTSSISGGNGVALTVPSGEKTSGTHTFTLATGADNAKVCILVPSASYGGTNAYKDFGLTVDIIEISATTPSNAGTNIQFYLYYDR